MHHIRNIDLTWDEELPPTITEQWTKLLGDLQTTNEISFQRRISITGSNTTQLHAFADASQKAFATAIYLRTQERDEVTVTLIFAKARVAPRKPNLIQRRLQEIRNLSNVEYCYVPTSQNPADLPSRGSDVITLQTSIWFTGPAWLCLEPNKWPPACIFENLQNSQIDQEAILITEQRTLYKPFHLAIKKFGTLSKLIRTTVPCIRFIAAISRKSKKILSYDTEDELYDLALLIWLKAEQSNAYSDVHDALKNATSNNLVKKLNLFLDEDNLIRCAGRFCNLLRDPNEKYSILLPNSARSHLTRYLIYYFHANNFHVGVEHTLTLLRSRYWVPRGRAAVYHTVKSCTVCQRYRARPFRQPTQSNLPSFWLQETKFPFTKVGVDTAGPLLIENQKKYILLATCLVTRAVPLELLDSMKATEFLSAFRALRARRGPQTMYVSDNASQFSQINQLLQRQNKKRLQWKFLPAASPWEGGVYERIVAITKNAILRTFHNRAISTKELRIILFELEMVLNSRPLTYVSEEVWGESSDTERLSADSTDQSIS